MLYNMCQRWWRACSACAGGGGGDDTPYVGGRDPSGGCLIVGFLPDGSNSRPSRQCGFSPGCASA